jgi:virulence-associated protein VagC
MTTEPTSTSPQLTDVFTSGDFQAVRLPEGFRLDGKVIGIYRRGDEVVLHMLNATDLLGDGPAPSAEEAVDMAALEEWLANPATVLSKTDF